MMETTNKVFVRRSFNCSAKALFEWLTKPELIAKWFGPKHLTVGTVDIQLNIGGAYSIELKKTNGQNFFITGKYLEINAPYKLVFSLNYEGLLTVPPKSIVRINLDATSATETTLTLVQDFEYTPSDMESRTEAWEHMLMVLNNQLMNA